jgi:uncharacterized protein (DUF433 family)
MATVEYAHVSVTSEGVPIISGTSTKVVEIVLDHLAHGSDAREIHREFSHLALGAIYSALAYYYDHQAQMDEDIAQRLRKVNEIKAELEPLQGASPIRLKLKALGLPELEIVAKAGNPEDFTNRIEFLPL